MSMVFRYSETANPDGTTCKRPAIPILFSNGDSKYDILSLIDSGADMSALDFRWAKLLNLDLSGKRTKSYGVTGSADTIISNVKLEIGKGHESYSIDVPVRVLFVDDTAPYVPTLIGRKGFFDNFVITIDESEQKVKLKHNGQE